ncbi:MAG: metallophosphoesterase [SAR324 cluster bacterium]|nr:metallophosphoesterase [SAR324 cluster bacterium]
MKLFNKKVTAIRLLVTFSVGLLVSLALAFTGYIISSTQDEPHEIRFLAFGDWGSGNDKQKAVAAAMIKKCKAENCEFVVTVGDNFYPKGVRSLADKQWKTKFIDLYSDLGVPFYAALGTHDHAGSVIAQVKYSKRNPQWIMPAKFYNFKKGPADFIITDSHKLFRFEKYRAQQTKHYKKLMRRLTSTWTILISKHTYISDGRHGNMGIYKGIIGHGAEMKSFFDSQFCGNVDLYLHGHDHNLQILEGPSECPGVFVVTGGGGAGAQPQAARDGNKIDFFAESFGFTYIKIIDNCITIEMLDEEGTSLFTKNYCKPQNFRIWARKLSGYLYKFPFDIQKSLSESRAQVHSYHIKAYLRGLFK